MDSMSYCLPALIYQVIINMIIPHDKTRYSWSFPVHKSEKKDSCCIYRVNSSRSPRAVDCSAQNIIRSELRGIRT